MKRAIIIIFILSSGWYRAYPQEDGDNKNAILNYEKSLQLNPGNENAGRILDKMKTQQITK